MRRNGLQKSGQVLEWAAQGGGGVTNPGGVQGMCRCGTKERGLVGNIGGRWFDQIVLEVFFKLSDSMNTLLSTKSVII